MERVGPPSGHFHAYHAGRRASVSADGDVLAGSRTYASHVPPMDLVCMVMDLVASEQCDGRQRADLASLPMTG